MPTPASTRSPFTDRRRLLTAIAALLAAGEFADAFLISFWEGAAVFSVLFAAGAFLIRRGGIGGPVLVAALCAFEIQSFPSWRHDGLSDWTTQIAFLVVSIVGVLVAVAVLKRAFDTRRARQQVARAGA
jgi:hypothetical protein